MKTRRRWPRDASMLLPSFSYDDAHCHRFERDGFVLFRHFLTHEAVRFLRDRVDEVVRGLHPRVDEEWVLNLHQTVSRVHAVGVFRGARSIFSQRAARTVGPQSIHTRTRTQESARLSVQAGSSWMRQLVADPQLLRLVEARVGPRPVLYCSQISVKRPRAGRSPHLHS